MPPVVSIATATAVADPGTGEIALVTPTAVRDGDALVVFLAATDADATVTAPDGWELAASFSGATWQAWVYWREADATPQTNTFTLAALGDDAIGILAVYRGADTADLFVASDEAEVSPASTSHAAAALTATTYSDLSAILWYGFAASTWTAPAAMTERAQVQSTEGSEATAMLAEELPEATGALSVRTATFGASATGFSVAVLLRSKPLVVPTGLQAIVAGSIGLG